MAGPEGLPRRGNTAESLQPREGFRPRLRCSHRGPSGASKGERRVPFPALSEDEAHLASPNCPVWAKAAQGGYPLRAGTNYSGGLVVLEEVDLAVGIHRPPNPQVDFDLAPFLLGGWGVGTSNLKNADLAANAYGKARAFEVGGHFRKDLRIIDANPQDAATLDLPIGRPGERPNRSNERIEKGRLAERPSSGPSACSSGMSRAVWLGRGCGARARGPLSTSYRQHRPASA